MSLNVPLKASLSTDVSALQDRIKGAFETKNALVSSALHQQKRHDFTHEEKHSSSSKEWLKIAVFGGLDGIVTIFCVMAGCAGASLSATQIMVVGIGNLLGDAISMGFGEYTSAQAEEEFEKAEIDREAWEMRHCPEDEQNEMIDLYQNKWGMSHADAIQLVSTSWKYPEFFLSHMMVEELSIFVDPDGGMTPKQKGTLMACAFLVFGAIPLVAYILSNLILQHASTTTSFILSCCASLLALFILGAVKSSLILEGFGQARAIKDGTVMMLNGTVAGSIAFLCGHVLLKAFAAGGAE